MNFNEFQKYRFLAENMNEDSPDYPAGAYFVKKWMKEEESLNESFWSAIWGWIKTHFSPTSKKINDLAKEFAQELEQEIRADNERIQDSKNLAAKMRSGYGGKLSTEIEEKMREAAGDDDDYRELVNHLITEKTYEVKKKLLAEYKDKLDDSDYDELYSSFDRNESHARAEKEKVYKEICGSDGEAIAKKLRKHIEHDHEFKSVIKDRADLEDLVKTIIIYLNRTAEKGKELGISRGDANYVADQFLKVVIDQSNKISSELKVDKSEIVDRAKSYLLKFMMADHPQDLEKSALGMRDSIKKDMERDPHKPHRAEEPTSVKDLVTTDHTDDILTQQQIDKTITAAKDKADTSAPAKVAKEISKTVKKFVESNAESWMTSINAAVEKFNKSSKQEAVAKEYEYNVNSEGKLEPLKDSSDVFLLMDDFDEIYGEIYPYYKTNEFGDRSTKAAIIPFLFEIYAIKKDPDGKLTKEDRNKIVDAIKQKYGLK